MAMGSQHTKPALQPQNIKLIVHNLFPKQKNIKSYMQLTANKNMVDWFGYRCLKNKETEAS
jgi:hypothetical protein